MGMLQQLALVVGLMVLPRISAVDFNRDVRPVLADNCFECHGPDAAQRRAELRLDTRAGVSRVVKAGDPVASELYRRLTANDPDERMPPAQAHRRPSTAQIENVRRWILEGGEFEEHWAFVAPVRGAVPELRGGENPIDGFVRAKLIDAGLQPRPEADRATLIRRLSLDLCGLPPSPSEVESFVADERPGAYARLVDRLLDSPRYGEHMAWGWMEAARYADTDGFQSDATRHMWRWRDWVIEAFNRNLPYDRFTVEQLAGDLLPGATLDQHLATGFNRNHRYDKGSGTIQAESIFENAADRLETTATVWLGLTMNCARCHDHKFDPISSREYYELLAFFDKVPENGQAILFNSHPRMTTPTLEQAERLAELEREVTLATESLAALEGVIAGQQRDWERALDDSFVERPLFRDALANRFHFNGVEAQASARGGKVAFIPGVRGRAARLGEGAYLELDKRVGNLWGREEFSLSFWFRLDDLGDGALISELDDPEDYRLGTLVDIHDGRIRFMLSHRWNYAVTWFEVLERLEANRWYHFAVTCDGRVQMLAYRAYLDGRAAEVNVIQDSAVDGKKVNVPMALGWSPLGPGFRGAMDELRFQRRVLTPDEVAALSVREPLSRVARIPGQDRTPAQAAALRSYFLEHVAAGEIAHARARLIAAERARKLFHDRLPTTMVMVDAADAPQTRVRVKGQYDQPGPTVQPDTPGVLPPFTADLPRDRLGLARWLMRPENPLTARVAVNRIWQHFFGRGFVASPENFGTQCAEPEQAALLDWLATEFVRLDWDVKALIRLIVNSATYRQSSAAPARQWRRDPENLHLARGPRFRLGAAALRDQALALSGLLVEHIGGESVFPFQPEGLWKLTSNQAYKMSSGADLYRRSLYTYWRRSIAPPTMALFDAPGREFCNVGVKRTNTPLQALASLNEHAFFEAAQALGRRAVVEGGKTRMERAEWAFQLVLGRLPTAEESRAMSEFLRHVSGDHDSLLANMLLNLDQAQTKE